MRGKAAAVRQARKLLSKQDFNLDDYSTNTPNGCEIEIEEVANKLDIAVIYENLPNKISGLFFKNNDKLAIGVNSKHSPQRRRFTIAHEIGHYCLHSKENLHYDKDLTDEAIFFRSDVSSLEEVEANHFAAELLMPATLIEKCINSGVTEIFQLASKFNVSEDAMNYRLVNLGYL